MKGFLLEKLVLLIILNLLSFSAFSQVRKIIKETVEIVAEKGLSKSSKKAAGEITEKISKTAIRNASEGVMEREALMTFSKGERALVASRMNEEALEKFINRSGFSENASGVIFKRLGITNARKVYSLIDNKVNLKGRKILLSDVSDKPEFLELITKKPNFFRVYKKVMCMGRSYRTNPEILEQVIHGKSPINIRTINDEFKGLTVRGVKYLEKTVELPNGLLVKGVFPKFPSKFTVRLPDYRFLDSDVKQMNYAFLKFRKQLSFNPQLQSQFPKDVVEDILTRKPKSVNTPFYGVKGYVWHHNEEKGVLELISTSLHNNAKHTGGKAIWGGGSQMRSFNYSSK